MIGFLSKKVKILWKIFQIDSTIFQICAHSKHSHSKKSIIILAFCSLIRTFATYIESINDAESAQNRRKAKTKRNHILSSKSVIFYTFFFDRT